MSTAENRKLFANNILEVYNTYSLDGIDIDWEYPGSVGDSGNTHSPEDTTNFLKFLGVLRATLPISAKISAAAQTIPFLGSDGDPIMDSSPFAALLDWVLIMNYDTWQCEFHAQTISSGSN